MEPTQLIQLTRISDQVADGYTDEVATEDPLEIRVEGRTIAVVMRTPGQDRELAAGFLFAEGLLKSAKDVFDITTCVASLNGQKGNAVDVGLTNPSSFDPAKLSRHVVTSSSCGVCSKASIDAVLRRRKPLTGGPVITPDLVRLLPQRLGRKQDAFRRTGGLHACALFNADGTFLAVREDVGRHNAFDKLIGWAFLEKRTPLTDSIAVLSGRASFEMVQKAYAAGITIVVAISAPSSLAVEFARQSGQTLVGFVRGHSMNVYAGAERIALTTS